MQALIIIDVQYDFLAGGALAVADGNQIIPIINKISGVFPLVVATQDWHPVDHGSFASNHMGKNTFDKTELNGLEQVLWPDHCVQGKEGANFSPQLDMAKVEAIFRKGTDKTIDSYSGFFDNGKRKSTGMAAYLSGRGVEKVYLAGLAGDYCVGYSAIDALSLGFETYVIEDAVRSITLEGWEAMKTNIINRGGKIILSTAIEQHGQGS